MKETITSSGEGLSKSRLLLEFWDFRRQFLRKIQHSVFSREQAEDIFQEACLKFLSSPAVFQYPQRATNYFCRILHTVIVDHAIKAKRITYYENPPEIICDPQQEWERSIMLDHLSQAVSRLPQRDQHLLSILFNPDLRRLRDKCAALQMPSSTMRHKMAKAVSRLRAIIGESP